MASELLKVSRNVGVTNSERVLIDGVSGHTYTILSILFCETAGAAETFDLYIDNDGKDIRNQKVIWEKNKKNQKGERTK